MGGNHLGRAFVARAGDAATASVRFTLLGTMNPPRDATTSREPPLGGSPASVPDGIGAALLESVERMPDGVIVVGYDFRIRYVNPVIARYLTGAGVSPDSVIGTLAWDQVADVTTPEWERALKRAASSRDVVTFEREGQLTGRWGETRIVPTATAMTAFTRDLHERHEMDCRSLEAQALLNAILDSASDAIFVKDVEGRYLAINAAGAAVLRERPDRIVGRTLPEILPGTVTEALRAGDLQVLRTGEPLLTEDSITVDGRRRYFLLSRSLWRDGSGEPAGIVGVATDITARRRVERDARLLADAGRVLAESLDYRATLSAVAQLVTPAFADWCSVVIRTREGTHETLAVAHADPDKVRRALEMAERYPMPADAPTGAPNVIRTGRSELYSHIPDEMLVAAAIDAGHLEALRALDVRSALIVPMQAHGRTLGALTLIGAESGRHFSEEDLPVAEEIGRRAALAIENAELFQAASAGSRSKSEFLASMSHELRTPLNAVLGYTQLLHDGITGPVSTAQQDQLLRIRASATHLLGLIDEVLSYSRLEAGREQVSFQDVDVATVLDESISLVRPMAAAKRLPLLVQVPAGAERLYLTTDVLKLRQILVNLLTNAVKFTDVGGITASSHADADQVVFTVRDTGIGIPAAHIERVFEPFWQVEQAPARRVGGTGLGLSVSRRLARLLGGELTVESTPGAGSLFTLRLPRGLRPAA